MPVEMMQREEGAWRSHPWPAFLGRGLTAEPVLLSTPTRVTQSEKLACLPLCSHSSGG